jgi:hypothetical protein
MKGVCMYGVSMCPLLFAVCLGDGHQRRSLQRRSLKPGALEPLDEVSITYCMHSFTPDVIS